MYTKINLTGKTLLRYDSKQKIELKLSKIEDSKQLNFGKCNKKCLQNNSKQHHNIMDYNNHPMSTLLIIFITM